LSTPICISITGEPNLRGYLVIDSTVNGSSAGGVRMAPDLSPELMVQLARVMTLKYGFVRLPVGGAKAGIVADPEMPIESKRELLKSFGQALGPFLKTRSYIPAEDLGISGEDVRFMLSSIGLKARHRGLTFALSGFYTGITVFTTAVAAARHISLDLNRASVAIEGFGSVGASAARMFWERGIRVVAISTSQGAIFNETGLDIGELVRLRDRVGSQVVNLSERGEKIDKSQLAELEVDIFSPCAQAYSITPDNANRVAAKIISPGANVPITPEAEPVLLQRKILVIPDFVANCGGVLGISMKHAGLKEDYIRHFLEHKIGEQTAKVIEVAEREKVTPRVYAQRIAQERFLKAKTSVEGRNIAAKAFSFALGLYRKRIIPYQVVTPVASRYFERRFIE
jgi:glutamate dehydrogenase/leucine dehydrogenase